MYSDIPKKSSDNSAEASGSSNEDSSQIKKSRNARASYICGQDIHGDAILASVGYRWKSDDLNYDDVTVNSFYRSLLSYQILLSFMSNFFLSTSSYRIDFGNIALVTSTNSEVMHLMFVFAFR